MTDGRPPADRLPTDPAELRLLVQALADGELDAATALALEHRLDHDPALAAEHGRIKALQSALRRLPRPEPDAAFHARIAALAAPAKQPARRLPRMAGWHMAGWQALAASMLLSAGLASGLTYWAARPGSDIAAEIAGSQRRALLAASPIDVATSDRHTVKPWLDARVGVSPPAVDLAKDGFPLLGGRIEVVGGQPVPALVYRYGAHIITVVAVPHAGATAPATDLSAGGFFMVRWAGRTFTYWAVSDAERPVLDRFVTLFQAGMKD